VAFFRCPSSGMGATGLERSANSTAETGISESGAAKSAALSTGFAADSTLADADLAPIVNRWPTLPADTKRAILAIVRSAVGPQ
jgi:hypothetical protein